MLWRFEHVGHHLRWVATPKGGKGLLEQLRSHEAQEVNSFQEVSHLTVTKIVFFDSNNLRGDSTAKWMNKRKAIQNDLKVSILIASSWSWILKFNLIYRNTALLEYLGDNDPFYLRKLVPLTLSKNMSSSKFPLI